MNNKKGDGKSVIRGILFAKNIGKAAFVVLLLLLATTFVASAECNRSVRVESWCCYPNTTAGWFYNITNTSWEYDSAAHTPLFNISIDGDVFDAYCINYETPLIPGDTFNASIYPAEPSCKNNSIAYILNNWTYSYDYCDNVSAAQSAIWYFWYINDTFCSLKPEPLPYNHTANQSEPGWESRWIPNCTAHQKACTFINASINKSVPYNIVITPSSGSFPLGTPVELEATVDYCAGENFTEVTVVFETDNNNCKFENDAKVFDSDTVNGIANATLICDESVDSVTVKTRVKDMKWFEIVDGTGCPDQEEYQETIKIVNITDGAKFSFSTHRVPVLSLPFLIFLAVTMSVIAIAAIRKRGKK